MTHWLSVAVAQDLVRVDEISVQVTEETLGTYTAPSLKIVTPQDRAIHIVPKARRVVGSFGRVDFQCGPKTTILIRGSKKTLKLACFLRFSGVLLEPLKG